MRKLNAIDAIGRRIAGGGTFAIVGAQAVQAGVKMDGVTRAATGVHTSFNRVAMRATGIGSAIAAAGEVSTSAMTKIANATASVAFGFGPQGAIVAAAAVAALAIVSIFTRARKEMEETDKKAREILKGLSLDTGVSRMTELWSGDKFAKPGSPAALGLPGARARLAEIQSREDADRGELSISQRRSMSLETQELTKWIKENEKAYAATEERVRSLTAAEVERNALALRTEHEEYEKKQAEGARGLGITRGMGTFQDAQSAVTRISADMEARLNKVIEKVTSLTGLATKPGDMQNLPAGNINKESGLIRAFTENAERIAEATAAQMRETIASIFGDAIYQGFAEAFSGKGIVGLFKGLGKSILSGLGSIFMQMGQKMVAASVLMQAFQAAITAFFPGAGIVAGLALMALGGAMQAAGGHSGGGGGTGGGAGSGGGGYYAQREDITRVRLMPGFGAEGANVQRLNPVVLNATIIGTNDPKAQRELQEMIDKGQRRG